MVDTDPDPVTVMMYVPAGVPFGLVVTPPPLLPQPTATNTRNKTMAPSGTSDVTRRLLAPHRTQMEIPKRLRTPSHGFQGKGRFVASGGTLAVRDVVEITNEAVEFPATVTAPQDTPVGNPVQVSG